MHRFKSVLVVEGFAVYFGGSVATTPNEIWLQPNYGVTVSHLSAIGDADRFQKEGIGAIFRKLEECADRRHQIRNEFRPDCLWRAR
ncbi:MAG: hypothetical protein MI923_17995 [Phycisphaerales bacterium]|nr:hypothetical protein [Phycisphaerales bacterium]